MADAVPACFDTRLEVHIAAPRAATYAALVEAHAVATWMVPDGMSSHVHAFEPREGGTFRISLTYDPPTGIGKTSGNTDTFHGTFVSLVPDRRVVWEVAFESADPGMREAMTVTFELADADGGTRLTAVHANVPAGVSPADNELGWRISMGKLAALVERPSVA